MQGTKLQSSGHFASTGEVERRRSCKPVQPFSQKTLKAASIVLCLDMVAAWTNSLHPSEQGSSHYLQAETQSIDMTTRMLAGLVPRQGFPHHHWSPYHLHLHHPHHLLGKVPTPNRRQYALLFHVLVVTHKTCKPKADVELELSLDPSEGSFVLDPALSKYIGNTIATRKLQL